MHDMHRRCHVLTTTVVVALSVVLVAAPRTEAGPPTERLRAFFADVNRVIADALAADDPAAHVATIYGLVGDLVDFRDAAQLVLGPEWQARTPAEREEFARLLAGLLERLYVSAAASKATLTAGIDVRYVGEHVDGHVATVETTIRSRSGDDVPLDYRMVERGGRWMVRDVLIDRVSVAENYRAQVQRLRRDWSYRELVAHVKARGEPAPPAEPAVIPVASTPALEPTALTEVTMPPLPASESAAIYWVQVGAFRSVETATQVAEALLKQQLAVALDSADIAVAGGPVRVVRVRVGPFADRAAAGTALRDLSRKGYAPFLAIERQ